MFHLGAALLQNLAVSPELTLRPSLSAQGGRSAGASEVNRSRLDAEGPFGQSLGICVSPELTLRPSLSGDIVACAQQPVFRVAEALLHDSTAARVGALFQLLVQDTTAQDFGLPSSAIRLRM